MERLLAPAQYFPLEKGLYEVAPGLRPLGTDFGNGRLDQNVFQVDNRWQEHRDNKLQCRKERLSKYYVTEQFQPENRRFIAAWIAEHLSEEYPEQFRRDGATLDCTLTREVIAWDHQGQIDRKRSAFTVDPQYVDAIDALMSQVQEDMGVIEVESSGANRLSCLHLCSPSHWAAEDKIGLDFFKIHAPIPGAEKLNRGAGALALAMVDKGPYVRFVWGFGTDRRLNHHPIAPEGFDLGQWRGRSFSLRRPENPFTLRVERQVTFGIPQMRTGLFFIRVSFIDGEQIRKNVTWRNQLVGALQSMSAESLAYKGLTDSIDDVVRWLNDC